MSTAGTVIKTEPRGSEKFVAMGSIPLISSPLWPRNSAVSTSSPQVGGIRLATAQETVCVLPDVQMAVAFGKRTGGSTVAAETECAAKAAARAKKGAKNFIVKGS